MEGTSKKILYIDMDNVLVDFASAFPHLGEETLREYHGHLDDVPGIFAYMHPVEGAVDAFQILSAYYDTYILSTAPWDNPSAWSDKLEWVKRYLGDMAYKRLILSHHKELNRGDYLVDDRVKNGAGEFEGEHILFGSLAYPDWASVVRYLEVGKILKTHPATPMEYADYDADMSLTCPVCGWKGTPNDGGVLEYHDVLLDVSCPTCQKMLLVVSYPKAQPLT